MVRGKDMRRLTYVLWLCTAISIVAVRADNVSITKRPQDILASQDFVQALSSLLSDQKAQEHLQKVPRGIRFSFDENDESSGEHDKKASDFYQDYILQYYPKVFVIRNLFECMVVEDVERALNDITLLFARQPWLYFVNASSQLKVPMYWEYIVDQCSFMNDFLQKARVDMTTKKIIYPKSTLNRNFMPGNKLAASASQTKNLYLYLKTTAKGCIYDFYALCFDYLIKLFNEGILLKNSKQVQRYLYELEFVVERLRGSRYESDYHEVVRICKELMNKLKKTLNVEELQESKHDNGDKDERTNKMIKEAKELGYV